MNFYLRSFRPWLAVSLFSSSAMAAPAEPEEVLGSVSSAMLALTITTTADATVNKDPLTGNPYPKGHELSGPDSFNTWTITKNNKKVEEVTELASKNTTFKYSNKEFLTDLVQINFISDIKGWSIVKVQATQEGTVPGDVVQEESGPMHIYLSHKTEGVRSLTFAFIRVMVQPTQVSTSYKSKKSIKFDTNGEPASETVSHSVAYKAPAKVQIRLRGFVHGESQVYVKNKDIAADGHYAGTEKLVFIGSEKKRVINPAAGKIMPLIGSYEYYEQQGDKFVGGLVEGSFSFGPGTAKDVSSFEGVTDPINPFSDPS